MVLGRLEEGLQTFPGILRAGKVTGGEFIKGRCQSPAFFVDPLLERLLLLEEVLFGVDEKDPLGNAGKDGPELDPAVSWKSRVREATGLRILRMETWTDLLQQTAHEAHGLGSPSQPMDAGGELGQIGRCIEGAVHDEAIRLVTVLHRRQERRDRLPEGLLVGGIPGEGLHTEREAALADGHEVEDELLQIIAVVLGEAVGDGHDKGRVVLVRLLLEAFERVHVAVLAGLPDRLLPSSHLLLALDTVGVVSVEGEGGGVEAQKTQRLLELPPQAPSKGSVHLGDPLHDL